MKLRILFSIMTFFLSQSIRANTITFTDRIAFDAFVGTSTIDGLQDIADGFNNYFGPTIRPGYSYDMSNYGCTALSPGCDDNSLQGFQYSNAYQWVYNNGSFNFGSIIQAFGLDFGNYYDSNATITLNGFVSQVGHGFFGIASGNGVGFNNISFTKSSSYALFDNVTYSQTQTSSAVPEPAFIALLEMGLFGFAASHRKKN